MAKKRGFLTLVLALVMAIGLTVPAWAEGSNNGVDMQFHTTLFVEPTIEYWSSDGKVTGVAEQKDTLDYESAIDEMVGKENGKLTYGPKVQAAIAVLDAKVKEMYAGAYTFNDEVVETYSSLTLIRTSQEEGSSTQDIYDLLYIHRTYTVNTGNKIVSVGLNDVTLNFKDGDAPKFTATVPVSEQYSLYRESYYENYEGGKGWSTDDDYNAIYYSGNRKLTAFSENQVYGHIADIHINQGYELAANCKFYFNGNEVPVRTESGSQPGTFVRKNTGEVIFCSDVDVESSQSAPRYYYNSTTATTGTNAPQGSPKTFDPGVTVYALSGLLSLGGLAVAKKRGR